MVKILLVFLGFIPSFIVLPSESSIKAFEQQLATLESEESTVISKRDAAYSARKDVWRRQEEIKR